MKDRTLPDVVFSVWNNYRRTAWAFSLSILFAAPLFAQGSVQRTVSITNANGNTIKLQSGVGTAAYDITLPLTSNPSPTTYSLLTASGSGQLGWTPTTGVSSGFVLTLQTSGGNLVPTFVNPSTLSSGNFVNYDVASQQNASTTHAKNLFNVSYAPGATGATAAGAVINSSVGVVTNATATGLTVTATGSGSGSSTGLSVNASGGTLNTGITSTGTTIGVSATGNTAVTASGTATGVAAIGTTAVSAIGSTTGVVATGPTAVAATGTVSLLSNGGLASALTFQNPAATFSSSFTAGAQTAAITYTLPITAPAANSILFSSGGATNTLTWTAGGANGQVLTISGGVPTWQNSAAGGSYVNYATTTPQNTAVITAANYLFNVAYAASATTNNALGAVITSTSGTSGVTNATGLTISSTANSTGTSTGLSVSANGGSANYAALFTNGNVGVGTSTPNASVDIAKDLATREYNYSTSISGTQNNVNFDGAGNAISMVRIQTATAPFSITGLAGGVNGKHLTVYNGSTQTMTIVNQSALSTATNRLVTGTVANLTLPSTGSANFIYSAQESRWICYAISGANGWLYTGNSGLVDNISNYHGTLDDVPIRFISGAAGAPSTKMLLDINGNLLFGKNSGTTSFSSGAGRLAFGDSLTTTRLNSVPTFLNRVFNMIDPNAVLRVWRFNTTAGGTDPAIELIGGTNDNQANSVNTWWDVHTTGTPGTTNTGTYPTGEHLCLRRRTGASDSEYVSIFSGGNVGVGGEGNGGVPRADLRLNVLTTDDITSAVVPVLALNHRVRGTPGSANGSGVGMLFRSETTTTNDQSMASINSIWTDATDATRTSILTFSTVNNGGTLTEAMRITGQKYIGFGTTAPTQLVEVGDGNLLLSNTTGTASQLQFEGTATGVSTFKAGAQGATTINYTLPTTQPTANQVLTASTVTGTGPYNVALGWGSGSGSSTVYAIKTADETHASTTTLQDDDELAVTLGANQTWEITSMIMAMANSTVPNLKMAFSLPAGASMRLFVNGTQDNTTSAYDNFTLTTSNTAKKMTIGVTNNATLIAIHGWITTSSTSGDVTFRWAQNTSNANSVIIKADSYITARQIQ
jgi:hypothetical protein